MDKDNFYVYPLIAKRFCWQEICTLTL